GMHGRRPCCCRLPYAYTFCTASCRKSSRCAAEDTGATRHPGHAEPRAAPPGSTLTSGFVNAAPEPALRLGSRTKPLVVDVPVILVAVAPVPLQRNIAPRLT